MAIGGFLVLLVVGMILLGGIVAVVMLLANPKTRVAGAVLVAIGLVVVVIAGVVLFGVSYRSQSYHRADAIAQLHEVQQQARMGEKQQTGHDGGAASMRVPPDQVYAEFYDAPSAHASDDPHGHDAVPSTVATAASGASGGVTRSIAMPGFLVLGLVVLGAIVGVVMLLANPKTRVAGAVLVPIGLLVLMLAGAAHFVISGRKHSAELAEARLMRTQIALRARAVQERGDPDRISVEMNRSAQGEPRDSDTPVSIGTVESPADPTAEAVPPTTAEAELGSDTPEEPEEPEGTDEKDAAASELEAGSEPDDTSAATVEAESTASENPGTPADAPKLKTEPNTASTPAKVENVPSTPRPSWVGNEGRQTADGYQVSVVVGPFHDRADCEMVLPVELQRVTSRYVRDYLSPEKSGRVRLATGYILTHIVQDRWEERVKDPLAPKIPMAGDESAPRTRLHVLLQFDHAVNNHIDREWKAAVIHQRLGYAGTGLASVLGLLGVLFGALKIDQSTGGKYRGRLSVASVVAGLAILAAAGGILALVHDAPWNMTPATPPMFSSQMIGHTASAPAEGLSDLPAAPTMGRGVALASWALLTGVLSLVVFVVLLLVNSTTRRIALGLAAIVGGFAVLVLLLRMFNLNNHVAVGPMEVLIVAVSAAYLVVITALSRRRWTWVLGLIACLVAGMLFTPADPLSMLLVAVVLCVAYTIAVFARRAGRENPASDVPNRDAAEVGQV